MSDKFYDHPCGIPPHDCLHCDLCDDCPHHRGDCPVYPPADEKIISGVCGTCGQVTGGCECPNGKAIGTFVNGCKIPEHEGGKFNTLLDYQTIEEEYTGEKNYPNVLCYLWNQDQSGESTIK